MKTSPKESRGSSLKNDEIRSIWDSDGDEYKQVAFDVAPTWDGGRQAACACVYQDIVCASGCVSELEVQSAPCCVNNRSATPSLMTGVGAGDFI